jgi:DTW domain-containing protein YfiP
MAVRYKLVTYISTAQVMQCLCVQAPAGFLLVQASTEQANAIDTLQLLAKRLSQAQTAMATR